MSALFCHRAPLGGVSLVGGTPEDGGACALGSTHPTLRRPIVCIDSELGQHQAR